ALGATGRTVRCSRCKEVWLAHPEDAIEPAATSAMMEAGYNERDAAADEWERLAQDGDDQPPPVVESPPIAGWSAQDASDDADWTNAARNGTDDWDETGEKRSWFGKAFKSRTPRKAGGRSLLGLPTACAAMGALAVALLIWRADMVRLLPQTAGFYRLVGLNVNLRGLAFKEVKLSTETVEGKPVLVIEGAIVGETRKAADLPRLRFAVRDAQGAEIYAWNTLLEQTVLQPGERVLFKSRLASPPAEGRNIEIRFFNRRDVAGGGA
ncbi:MJ0042-type zinc finger domain-containing protein, partial [Bradyrhizobium sp.]